MPTRNNHRTLAEEETELAILQATEHNRLEQLRPLRDTIQKLREGIYRKKNEALIGRCFKYQNSYGGGSHWWLYIKIIGADKDGAIVIECQNPEPNQAEISKVKKSSYMLEDSSYIPITEKEFRKTYNRIKRQLTP